MVKYMRNLLRDVTRATAFLVAGCMVNMLMAQSTGSHRVRATLMNQQSSLHTSLSNRDVYLLRVTPRKGGAFDAIAVDSYPGYAEALPLHGMSGNLTFSVRLIRTPYCDLQASDDGQEEPIRCFSIKRDSFKAPKSAASDLWWK